MTPTLLLLGVILALCIACVVLLVRLRRLDRQRKTQQDLSEAGILASGLAHEIRNPLNSIKINMQLMEEDLEEQIQDPDTLAGFRETFRLISYEIGRLNELMTNFLTYARPVDLQPKPVELNRFLDELAAFLRPQADEKGVALVTELPDMPVHVRADPQKLRQALLNILINDIQILSEGGEIRLTLQVIRELAVIHIADNGPGMTESFMKEVFTAFKSQRKGGTGLGLSIANRFIQAHGGGIKVDSAPGEGTTFSVILPQSHDFPSGGGNDSP